MTTLLNAKNVGDQYRDSGGNVVTIMHIDGRSRVVRRKGRGLPTYVVRIDDELTGMFATLDEAMASL
jgi:hypothetical protein